MTHVTWIVIVWMDMEIELEIWGIHPYIWVADGQTHVEYSCQKKKMVGERDRGEGEWLMCI